MREFNPSDDEFEYYEDTHNASGDYVGATEHEFYARRGSHYKL